MCETKKGNKQVQPADDSLEQVYEGSVYDSSLESPRSMQAAGSSIDSRPARLRLLGFNRMAFVVTGVALGIIILIGLASVIFTSKTPKDSGTGSQKSANFAVGSIPVQGVKEAKELSVGNADHLTINGQLKVANGVVLSPSNAPSTAVAGQLYYDKTTNAPYYYNGTSFVSLAAPRSVNSLGGSAGAISLGTGLQVSGNTLSVSSNLLQSVANAAAQVSATLNTARVSSIQGLTGDITFTAGNGIGISGTTISNQGVISLTSLSSNLAIGSDGSGHYTVQDTSSGISSVNLGPAAAQSDSSGNTSINIDKTGTGDFLNFASSGVSKFVIDRFGTVTTGNLIAGITGTAALGGGLGVSGNSLVNTGVISVAGTANQIDVSASTGAITFSLPANLVSAGNANFGGSGTFGSLIVNGSARISGLTGGVVTADGAGNLSSSVLDRNGVFFNNTLSVANGGTGAASLTTNGVLYGGAGAIQATAAAANSILATDGSSTPGLTQTLPAAVQGNITTTGILTSGSIGSGFGSISTTNAISTTAALQGGSLSVAGGSFTVASGTGNVVIAGSASIQGAGGLTVGVPGSVSGSVVFANGSNSHIVTLQGLAPSGQDQTITIPASSVASDQICLLSLANCAGAGGAVLSPSGTQNYITKYTNAAGTQIGNSLLFDNGTTVGVNTNTPNAAYVFDVNGAANVGGALSVGASLTVSGNSTFNGNLTVSGGNSFSTGSGAVSLNGNTSVTGSNTFTTGTGAASFGGSVTATGLATFNGGATVNGTTNITGALNINTSGAATVTIGNNSTSFSLASSGLNVTSGGALSGVSTLAASGAITAATSGNTINGIVIAAGALSSVTSINASGAISAATSGNTINGAVINGGALSNITGIAISGAYVQTGVSANTFSGDTSFTGVGNGIDVTNNANIGGNLTVQGGTIALGTAVQQGSLALKAGNSLTGTIQVTSLLGQDTVYTLPDPGGPSAVICLNTGNCAGTGGGVTTTGGTAGRIAKFSAAGAIVNSGLSESGSTLSYAGTAVINAASGFTGNLLDLQLDGVSKLSVTESGALTTASTLTVLSGGAAITGNSTITGNLTGLTGLTSSGTITFSGLGTAGIVHADGSGVLTSSKVVLGSETTGNYVATLGTLTGLTTTGNTGAGSSPTLSITYGSGANTSVQGNTQLVCPTGTGNLSGGGNTITLGAGGTCGGLTVVNSPTFSGNLTAQGAGGLTAGLSNGASGVDGVLNLASGANNNVGTIRLKNTGLSQNTTYLLPDTTATDTICLYNLSNCGAANAIAGTGTINQIAKFTGANAIGDSLISDDGTNVTIGGNLVASSFYATNIQSSGVLNITPGGALSIGASNQNLALQGNGTSTFTISSSGFTSALGFVAPTANRTINLPNESGTVCLQGSSNCGFATSGSGVTGITGTAAGSVAAIGNVVFNDALTTAGTITINNAKADGSTKGIATFNATNFSAASGVINTIQNINSTAAVTFGSLTLGAGGDLSLSATGTVKTDKIKSSSAGGGITFDAQNGSVTITTDGGLNSFVLPSYGGLGQVICTSGITCATGGGTAVVLEPSAVQTATSNGTAIYINKASGSGNLIQLQTGGVDAFTIDNTGKSTFGNDVAATNVLVSGVLTTNVIAPTGPLTIGAVGQPVTLQGDGTSVFTGKDAASGFTTSIGYRFGSGGSAPTGNIVYQLQNDNMVTPGTYDICTTAGNCAGVGGGVTTSGGTPGAIAKFTTAGNIEDSLISEASSTITVAGNLAVGVSGASQVSIGVASSATGTLVFNNSTNANTITLQQTAAPAGNVTIGLPTSSGTIAVGASGPLSLDPVTGILSCATCLSSGGGGAGGVTSLNGLTGVLSVANASASGATITIDNAKADGSTKGIATFNATNFSDNGSGVINTAQNINTGASPTFANLSLQGTTGLSIGSSSNLGQLAFKDGTASGFTSTFTPATLTASRSIVIPNASGTVAVSASGNLALSALGDLTISNAPSFTTSVTTPSLQAIGNLAITPGAGGVLTIGANANSLALQGNGSTTIKATNGAFNNTISFAAITATRAITIPDASGTICLSSGNCLGGGGGAANTALSNLVSVAINTTLQPGVAAGADLGTSSLPFGQLVIAGASGTPGTNNFVVTGTSTGGTRTITLPDASGTLCIQSDAACGFAAANNVVNSITGTTSGSVAAQSTLVFNNALTTSGAITIDDAKADGSTKGIAAFNATNFTAVAGVVNTVQGISTAATPTFAGLTLSSALTVTNGGTGASTLASKGILYGNGVGAIQATASAADSILATNGSSTPALTQTLPTAVQGNITSTGVLGSGSITSGFGTISTGNTITTTAAIQGGSLTAGSSSQFTVNTSGNITTSGTAAVRGGLTLGLQSTATGSLNFANATNGNLLTITSATAAANRTYTLPDSTGNATDTLCLQTLGNCAGSGAGVTATGGVAGYLSVFTAAQNITSSQLYDNGSFVGVNTATNSGQLSIAAAGTQTGLYVFGPTTGTSAVALIKSGGGTGDLLDMVNSGGTTVAKVDSSGALTAAGLTVNGTTALNGNTSVSGSNTFTTGSGQVKLGSLGTGLVKSDNTGVLSSGVLDRNDSTYFNTLLSVGNGGTGASTFATNGILYGNGTGAVQATAAANNSILATGAGGVPGLTQTLPVAVQGNITSVGALTGGSIASGFGTIATGNNITTTATLQGGTLVATGTSNLIGTTTFGTPGTANGILAFGNSTSTNTVFLQGLNPTGSGNVTLRLPVLPAGTVADLCTTTGNCAGSGTGVTASVSGTTNKLAKFTAGQNIGDSQIFDDGTFVGINTLTNAGQLSIVSSGAGQTSIFAQGVASATVPLAVFKAGATPGAAADILQLQTSSGTAVAKFDATGNVTLAGSLKLTGSTSFPSSPTEGQIYFRTDNKQLYVYENGKWTAQGGGSSTVVVAASNSQNKEKADYVADGTNDEAEINTALSSLPATGGSVVLLDGTYNIGSTNTINKTNVTLVGQGGSTVLKRMYDSASSEGLINIGSGTIDMSNITVTRLAIDGNKATYSSANNVGLRAQSLSCNSVYGTRITELAITNTSSYGIMLNGLGCAFNSQTFISSNTIKNTTDSAINLAAGSYGVTVNGNAIFNAGANGVTTGTSVSTISITNNQIVNSTGSNIVTNDTNPIQITGNTLIGAQNGIAVSFYNNATTITGNNISGASVSGINISSGNGATVSGNSIANGAGIGIYVQADDNNISGNTITNNTGEGIFIYGGNSNSVSGNDLYNNASTGSGSSIHLSNNGTSQNTQIIGNKIRDTAGTGYAIKLDAGASVVSNYLSSNTYGGTGATSILDQGTNTQYGNQVDGNGYMILRGNAGVGINTTAPTASLQNAGGFINSAIASPAAPTVAAQGTTGVTTWGYKVTAYDGIGETLASTETTIANGNATLNSSNYNLITPTRVSGAVSYKIYRTTAGGTPATTGLIGTLAGGASTFSFSDTGLAASGSLPTSNTTGSATIATYLGLNNASPANRLSINGITTSNANTTAAQILVGTGSAANIGLVIQGVASQSGDLLQAQNSAGATVARIDSAGNVNTTGSFIAGNPAGQNATFTYTGGQGSFGLNGGSSTFTFNGNHVLGVLDVTAGATSGFINNVSGAGIGTLGFVLNGSYNYGITTDSGRGIVLNPNGTEAVRVTSTGNVGIGTISPASLLNVGANTTNAAGGITLGTDTNLYRSAAATLKTDGSLVVGTLGTSGTALLCIDGTNQLQQCATGGGGGGAGAGNFVLNGTSVQTNGNFYIRSAAVGSVTAQIEGANGQTANLLNLNSYNGSTSTTVASFNASGNLTLAGTLKLTGNSTANRPSSPTEGTVYYDTTIKSLLVYANGKWQADRSSSTFIVAASNSINKDKADYVGNGTADDVAINAAIAALPSSGGSVVLLEGTYNITATITANKANLHLVGQGSNTVLKRMFNGASSTAGAVIDESSNDVQSFSQFAIDGNKATYTGSGISRSAYGTNSTFTSLTLYNSSFNGINLFNGGKISNSVVYGSNNGIFIDGNDTVVSNNVVYGNTNAGINENLNRSYNVISNNVSYSNDVGIVANGNNTVVSSNTVNTNTTSGITFAAYGGQRADGNTVSGNGTGIILGGGGGSSFIVSNNKITSNTGDGVSVSAASTQISNNTIDNNGGNGINIGNFTGGGNIISGNTITNNGGSGASNGVAIGITASNRLINNVVTDTAGSGYAISIPTGATDTYLQGNTFSGTGATTILNSGTNTVFADQQDSNGNMILRGNAGVGINTTAPTASLQNTGSLLQGGLATPAAPTVTNLGTAGSTSYTYAVTAYDGLGETLASTGTTTATGATTLNSTDFNRIVPTRVNGAVSYKIYRTASGGTPATTGLIGTLAGGAATFQFDDTGIAASGSTPTFNTTGGALIQTNGGVTIQNATNTSTVFSASANNKQVLIGGLNAPTGFAAVLIGAANTPSISNNGTAGSTAYSYQVVALTAAGYATVPSTAGSTATGNATLTGVNSNTVSWTAVSGATSYQVYRSASSGTPSTTGLIGSTTSTSLIDTGLSVGVTTPTTTGLASSTTYYYKVTAFDSAGGQTTASTEVSQATSATRQSIALSWAAVPGARSYRVYRGTSSNGENVYFNATNNSFTDYGTSTTSGSPPTTGNAYTTSFSQAGTSQLTLGTAGLASGQLYVGSNAGGVVSVSTVGTAGASAQNYEVTAIDANGQVISGSAMAGNTATANATLSVTNYDQLSWQPVPGAVSYNIYAILNSRRGLIGTSNTTTFNDTGQVATGGYPASPSFVGTYGPALTGSIDGTNYGYSLYSNVLKIVDLSAPTVSVQTVGTVACANCGNATSRGQFIYTATSNQLQVFDVSNPSNPTARGTASILAAGVKSIATTGNYVYVTTQLNNLLIIYDVSNPDAPIQVGSVAITNVNSFMTIQGKYAYIGGNSSTVEAFDISNPRSPVLAGSVTIPSNLAGGITVSGRYVYAVNGTGSLVVIDIANPTKPVLVSTMDVAVSSTPFVSGRFLYVNSTGNDTFVKVFDISNPAAPIYTGAHVPSTMQNSNGPFVKGNYLYEGTSGNVSYVFNLGGAVIQNLEAGAVRTASLQVDTNTSVGGSLSVSTGLSVSGSSTLAGQLGVGSTLTVQGATQLVGGLQGGVTVNGLSAPSAPTVTTVGTAGTTNYSYQVVAVGAGGGTTLPSPAGSTATGNATLDSTNYNSITWTGVAGAVSYKIYRTVAGGTSPTTTGLISTTTGLGLSDTGLAASGAVPTTDSSGQLSANGGILVPFNQGVNFGDSGHSISAAAGVGLTISDNNSIYLNSSSVRIGYANLSAAAGQALIIAPKFSAADVALVARGFASQTADLFQLQNSSGTVLSLFDAAGNLKFGPLTAPTFGTITPSITGGSMNAGSYYYKVSARDAAGNETTPGVESAVQTIASGSTGSVVLNWGAITGAASYKVYRTTTSGTYSTPALVGTVVTNTFTDTLAAPGAGAPAATNTAYNSSISVTNATNYFSGNISVSGAGGIQAGNEHFGAGSSVGSTANTTSSLAVGSNASAGATGGSATSIGAGSAADSGASALGRSASALGDNGLALGRQATTLAGQLGSIAIGFQAATTASNQLVIGAANTAYDIRNVYVGSGVTNAAPNALTIQGTGSATAGTAGAAVTILGGAGATATSGSSGGTLTLQGGNSGGTGNNQGGTLALTGGTSTGTTTGSSVTIKGGTAAGSNQVGGNVTISGGAPTGTGASGSVIVKPTTNDSTTAFQVQNAAGTSMLNVDSTISQTTLRGTNSDGTLGAEQIATAGTNDFTTNWTTTNWTIGGGNTTATHVAGNTSPLIYTGFTPTNGVVYQVTFTFTGNNTSNTESITPKIGGTSGNTTTAFGNTETQIITASSTASLQFVPSSGWYGTISGVSVKVLTTSTAVLKVQNSTGVTALEVRAGSSTGSTIFGLNAGKSATSTANYTTAFGANALQNNTTGNLNTAVGGNSLAGNVSGGNNTALGYNTLASNITGSSNVAVGTFALQSNTYGGSNTATGYTALGNNTYGGSNSAYGTSALSGNTLGSANAAFGSGALQVSSTGGNNTAVGAGSLSSTTTGSSNTALGAVSGQSNTTGTNNTFIGISAGSADNSGSFVTGATLQNATAIGALAQVQASNSLVLGGQGSNAVNVGIGTTIPTNTLSVSPIQYSTGTASRTNSSTAVVGTGTTWTSAMIGSQIIFNDGFNGGLVTAVADATHLTMTNSYTGTTDATPVNYRIHYAGLQVTSSGNVGINNFGPTNKLAVNVATTADSLAQALIATGSTGNRGVVIQGVASQAANLFETQTSTGGKIFGIDPAGKLLFGGGGGSFDVNLYRVNTTTLATDNTLTVGGALSVSGSAGGVAVFITGAAGGNALRIGTAGSFDVDRAGTVGGRFTVQENGNVGIGSSSAPAVRFEVNSAAAGTVVQTIVGSGAQTADLLQLKNSSGTTLSSFTANGSLQGGNGSGTDTAGTTLSINGGQGTGTGAGGGLNFQIAKPAGSTGSSLNALATVFGISGTNGAATFKNAINGTSALVIQNSSSVALFSADTTNNKIVLGTGTPTLSAASTGGLFVSDSAEIAGQLRLGDGTNNVTVDATNHQIRFNGNSRNDRKVTLTAEYAGAALDADGSNNTGTMTSGYDGTNKRNYYNWTTNQGSNQDYDIVVQIPLPSDYSSAGGAYPTVNIDRYTSDITNGTITATLLDTAGAAVTNWNTCAQTPGSASTWTGVTGGCTISSGTFAADGVMTLRLHIQSPNGGSVRVGNIVVGYKSAF